jgi:hypothetical protein
MKHQMHFVQLNQLMQKFSLFKNLYCLVLFKNPKKLVELEKPHLMLVIQDLKDSKIKLKIEQLHLALLKLQLMLLHQSNHMK